MAKKPPIRKMLNALKNAERELSVHAHVADADAYCIEIPWSSVRPLLKTMRSAIAAAEQQSVK